MSDYVTRVVADCRDIPSLEWDQLVDHQGLPSPFMRHAYLCALQESGSAKHSTGWDTQFVTLYEGNTLVAACPFYVKDHSYGEYVFDWAWARAYAQHRIPYYPKGLVAVPFTPVPGDRLLARTSEARGALVRALIGLCASSDLSSLHILFASPSDVIAGELCGMTARQTVQFHWHNRAPGYESFDQFLGTLSQDKRKKIRQERRKVHDAGVRFRCLLGSEISVDDWSFFYQCYERTYLEHGNPPYLTRDFFHRMQQNMPQAWLMFIAERDGKQVASSLIGIEDRASPDDTGSNRVAYGRYWGALERVDCLHFEACYYQPIEWCIRNGFHRFEGGAQGEHKMSRALLPTVTQSLHWIAHPEFSNAIKDFLQRESAGVDGYVAELELHSPFKKDAA